jgi:hypothetical protein
LEEDASIFGALIYSFLELFCAALGFSPLGGIFFGVDFAVWGSLHGLLSCALA